MQLSRLFEIVYILLSRGRVTAKALAERFEVSTRTIYRDIEALSMAGVPVYCTQGAGGGIYISEGYVLSKSTLSDEEQAQILLALKSLSATEYASGSSLLSRLGSLFSKSENDWIEIDFSRWGYRANDRVLLSLLKDAITGRKKLSFSYFSAIGEKTDRTVCPTKLIYKQHAWYIQAFDPSKNAYRTFKVFRMADVRAMEETFVREVLPAAPALEYDSFPQEPLYPVTLKFHPASTYRVYDMFDPKQVTRDADGALLVYTCLENDGSLLDHVLSFGAHAEVLSPPALRRAVANQLHAFLARYEHDIQMSALMPYALATKSKEDNQVEMQVCQSCAMPLEAGQYGTNKDGTENTDYCKYCYENGAFTSDQTIEEMIETCIPFMVEGDAGMPEAQARKIMEETLPKLKRWQK